MDKIASLTGLDFETLIGLSIFVWGLVESIKGDLHLDGMKTRIAGALCSLGGGALYHIQPDGTIMWLQFIATSIALFLGPHLLHRLRQKFIPDKVTIAPSVTPEGGDSK